MTKIIEASYVPGSKYARLILTVYHYNDNLHKDEI